MKLIASFVALITVLGFSGCKEEEVQSTWMGSPLTIDGKMEDWEGSPFVVFEDEGFAVGVKNDSMYLYVAGKSTDAALRRIIERTGITLWLDPEGGKNQDLEINFPVWAFGNLNRTRGGFWQALTEAERGRALEGVEETRQGVLVIDKRNVDSRVFPGTGAEGFAARIGSSPGLMFFEVRIPFMIQNYFLDYGPLGKNDRIGIGVKLGAFRPEEFAGARRRGSGGFGPPGGRGPRGRGRGVPSRDAQPDIQPQVWMEVILAKAD